MTELLVLLDVDGTLFLTHDPLAGIAHRREDRRVAVTERRAHLARREVEDPAAVSCLQPAARGGLDEQVGELAPVANQLVRPGGSRRRRGLRWGGGDAHG